MVCDPKAFGFQNGIRRFRTLLLVTFAAVFFGVGAFGQESGGATGQAPSTEARKAAVAAQKIPARYGVDILSDTRGVDFGPYLTKILLQIKTTWLPLIPEDARPPKNAGGETQIRFSILPDGRIGAMHLESNSHNDGMNRAAWGAITGVGQFPPLPGKFTGPDFELRVHFLVNRTESAAPPAAVPLTE